MFFRDFFFKTHKSYSFTSTINKITSISIALENTAENQAIIDIDDTTPNSTIANNTKDLIPVKPENQQETNSTEDTTKMIGKGG